MEKASKFVASAFYIQLLLIIASVVILLANRNGIDKLDVLLTSVPAIILAPIILISGLIVLIKRHKVSLSIWAAIYINLSAGLFFFYLVLFGQRYNF